MRVALVGAGPRAIAHVEALRASGLADVVGVWDRTADRADALARKVGLPSGHDTIESLIESTKPDLVDVVTHPMARVEVITRARRSGMRLLVHEVVLAQDGSDYVPGRRGYRMLTEDFVLDNITECDEERLAYLAVHCHPGHGAVGFSGDDNASHERGYPALLGIVRGMPVGALVFSADSVAGDIWLPDGSRVPLERLNVVGRRRSILAPTPLLITTADPMYDRQSRLFGDRGQAILKSQRVAVVGLGGGGCLVSQQLSHLGVGELLLIDPDRVEKTNLPRIVGATRLDALIWMTNEHRPIWARRLGHALSTPKVSVAKRVARWASRITKVTTVRGSVEDAKVAAMLRDCDQIFLAADSAVARHVVSAVAHQYLIPVTQIGAKVSATRNGLITDVFSVSRSSTPGAGCMWCNELIDQDRLRKETTPVEQLERQRYVDDVHVPAPSVISLNAIAAAAAVNDWLMCVTGLTDNTFETEWLQVDARSGELQLELPRRVAECRECGRRRFARGDGLSLPTRLLG